MAYMKWLNRRREAKAFFKGAVRLKYILHLLPDRILVRAEKFHGTVNRKQAAERYGEYFIDFIQPRGYDVEIILKPKGDK